MNDSVPHPSDSDECDTPDEFLASLNKPVDDLLVGEISYTRAQCTKNISYYLQVDSCSRIGTCTSSHTLFFCHVYALAMPHW